MSNGSENIEARLAAYIEGDLPESDRGAIEQYLAQNPSHRQLIEELRGQKRNLSSLPRERAPAEVLDHLQSHLERQALLENVEEAASSMHINRWPQWTAVAAMLLLTVGLGYVVVQVLPGGNLNREQVAIAPSSVQQLPEMPALGEDAKSDRSVLESAKRAEGAAESENAKPFLGKGGGDAVSPGRRGDDFVDKIAADMSKKSMSELEALALNNGSAIVVSTDDPLITQNLLAGWLGQQDFAFKPVQTEVAVNAKDLPAELKMKTEQMKQSVDQQPQQPIGTVVEKVQRRSDDQKMGIKNADAYLVVKNVSTEQARSINRTLNEQRAGRQQARYYTNTELYPELQDQRNRQLQQQPIEFNAAAPTQQQQAWLGNTAKIGISTGETVQNNAPATNGTNGVAEIASGNDAPGNAITNSAIASPTTTQPAANQRTPAQEILASQSQDQASQGAAQSPDPLAIQAGTAQQNAALQADLTDVLIVVRAETGGVQNRVVDTDRVAPEARDAKEVAPGTTQPSAVPANPAPTTAPATQPAQ